MSVTTAQIDASDLWRWIRRGLSHVLPIRPIRSQARPVAFQSNTTDTIGHGEQLAPRDLPPCVCACPDCACRASAAAIIARVRADHLRAVESGYVGLGCELGFYDLDRASVKTDGGGVFFVDPAIGETTSDVMPELPIDHAYYTKLQEDAARGMAAALGADVVDRNGFRHCPESPVGFANEATRENEREAIRELARTARARREEWARRVDACVGTCQVVTKQRNTETRQSDKNVTSGIGSVIHTQQACNPYAKMAGVLNEQGGQNGSGILEG